MNQKTLMFADLGRNDLRKYALLAVAGEAEIKVLLDGSKDHQGNQLFALPWIEDDESWTPNELSPYSVPDAEAAWDKSGWNGTWFELSKFLPYLKMDRCLLPTGFYVPFEGPEIANLIATHPETQLVQLSWEASVLTSIMLKGRRMRLFCLSGERHINPIEWVSQKTNQLAFVIKESQRTARQQKPRTRIDTPAMLIDKYLDQCDESGQQPDVGRCHVFLSNQREIDVSLDGELMWSTQAGDVKHLTKRKLGDRLKRAIERR